MRFLCSFVILLGLEDSPVVEQIRVRVVAVDQEDLGDIPSSGATLDLDDDVEGVGDVRLDCAVGQLDPALQNAARKPRKSLLRRISMNRGQCAGMSRVQELQEIECLASANFAQNDAIGTMTEGRFQKVANSDGGEAILFPARLEPYEVLLTELNLGCIFYD